MTTNYNAFGIQHGFGLVLICLLLVACSTQKEEDAMPTSEDMPYARFLGEAVDGGVMTESEAMDLLTQYNYFYLHFDEYKRTYNNKYVLIVNEEVIAEDTLDEAVAEAESRFPGRPYFHGRFPDEE